MQYGYYLLFTVLFLENTVFVGLIIPGETVLLLAGVFAGRNFLDLKMVITVGFLASTLGNICGYFIGLYRGRPLLERFGKRIHLFKYLKKTEVYFTLHGRKTVFIGRFAAGVRVFIAALAGASQMEFGVFLLYTVTSSFLWTLSVTLLGYFFGSAYQQILLLIKQFSLIFFIVVIIIVCFYIWRKKFGKK